MTELPNKEHPTSHSSNSSNSTFEEPRCRDSPSNGKQSADPILSNSFPPNEETTSAKQPRKNQYKVVTKITKEVSNGNESRVELDIEALKSVLKNPKWADYNVAVYSIAGPFRSGKSFLLSILNHYFKAYFQVSWRTLKYKKEVNFYGEYKEYEKYVRSHFNEIEERADQKLINEVEKVFSWKGGLQRCTDGIYILSQPILFPPKKHQVALFLMDTVGLFDHQTSTQNSTFIGALSFLMSSLQIFNLKERIESIHLEQVYKFSEIARRVRDKVPIQENMIIKYFRKLVSNPTIQREHLMFVVRDWENEEEFPLGIEGGNSYLDKLLTTEKRGSEVKEHILMKNFLKDSFEEIDCMLLPHPGSQLRKAKDHLVLKDMDPNFEEKLQEMFEHVGVQSKEPFKEKFYPKKIQGNSLTCRGLYHHIKVYAEILKEGIALDIESLIQNQLESKMIKHVWEGFEELKSKIKDKVKELWETKKHCVDHLENFVQKIEAEFESKIPSHSMKSFQNEWKKEFANLMIQIVNAVEVCIAVEKLILDHLDKFCDWRRKNISSNQLLSDEEKTRATGHREEIMKKLNEEIKVLSGKMHSKPEPMDDKQKQTSTEQKPKNPKTGNPKRELKDGLRNFVADQYKEKCLNHFNKIVVEAPKKIPSVYSQFCLDLVLGDIDIRPYQDFTSQTSPSTSSRSEDLALSRFLEGAVTVRYLFGEVTIPLNCFK